MPLPKISYPQLSIKVPPSNKNYTFRPMLVKEEKVLLMAKQSEDDNSILQALKQVCNNCLIDDQLLDINKLPIFALEYIFLKLRGYSIGDQIKVSYRDFDDDKVYDFNVDLNKVEIKYPEKAESRVEVTSKSGVTLKHPYAGLYDDQEFLNNKDVDAFYLLCAKCIDQVYDGDNVYNGADFDTKDLLDFLDYLDIKSFEKVRLFMLNVPSLYYKLEYTNSKGAQKTIELKSLSDFFTLR